MPIYHAVILGIVQGLSEFLPISSSGHLLLVPWLFGWDDFDGDPSVEKAFDVALHIGTLVAAIVYFRRDLARYIGAGLHVLGRNRESLPGQVRIDGRVGWLLLLSTVPAALIGAVFGSEIDENLGKPVIIGLSLIFFGVLLGLADRVQGTRAVENFTARDALVIGASQALALNPGTSRSGITMTAGRFVRFSRDSAARISFLMMIPITVGAVLYKGAELISDGIPEGLLVPMIVGIISAGISGWFAVWGLLRLVRTRTFMPFVIYRIALGVIVLLIAAAGWR